MNDQENPACLSGAHCRDWLTCDESCELGRGSYKCMLKHQRHECVHDFGSGPWIDMTSGGTASCACGETAMGHSMRYGP